MTEYIRLTEEIAAKSKQLFEITQTLGKDNDVDAVIKAGLVPGAKDSREVASEVQRRAQELTELNAKREPYKAIEDAKTLASEYERRFNRPAADIIEMPGDKPKPDGLSTKDFGKLFVESRAYRAWKDHRAVEVTDLVPVNLRAALFQTSAGWAVESPPPAQVTLFPVRPLRVADFMTVVRWGEAIYTFMEETTHTDTAAEKAEGIAYAEAAFVLTKREKNIRKITNSLPVTDEQLTDVAGAEDFVRGRLEYQLRARLDKQILAGDNVAPNIEGTENVTGIQTQALGTDTTEDAVYKLLRVIRDNGFAEPEVVFIAPSKWETVRLRKTPDGIYLYGPPSAPGPETLWGLPAVQTTAHTATKAVAGAYRAHSLLAVRQDIEFAIGFTGTQFTEGEKTIRADIRAAMVHLRPKAFGNVTGL